ncbi:MAG: hypothetical protein ACUVWR_13760 [Anaerolineae bacterium]
MSTIIDSMPQMLPHASPSTTSLVQDGCSQAIVIYPGRETGYRELAQILAAAIQQRSAARLEVLADNALMPARDIPLPQPYRHHPLILLGNLNTNRAILPLYARYYCATDATYPGGDGYDLRTLVNPYGVGSDVILAGGSTQRGVGRAVERLIAHVNNVGDQGELQLPFLLEVELEPGLATALAEWPETSLGKALPQSATGLISAVGPYAILYAWTADRRYGEYARDCLRELNARVGDSYGDWHYLIERIVRAVPWLVAGGFLDEADLLRTDQLLLGTALETADMWWRKRDGYPPLGHRHHGKGTFAFYLQARYLLEQARPNAAARRLCARWLAECRQFLNALAQARIDDQDDETTLNNLATLFWYALGEERFQFFESGNARLIAERAIALHDNMGAGAGQGGYTEAVPCLMYLQQEATVPVSACAFYYQDSHLKWILERMPHLRTPLRLDGWSLSPIFMHKFDTGPELPAAPSADTAGVQVLPITPYQHTLCSRPPEHIENRGHSVNAPETWLLPPGIGLNILPIEKGFDKIVFRQDFEPGSSYLLLQGYQGGWRWQGHMHGANAIARFSQGGHIWLLQNTDRQLYYYKNGLTISDGYNDTPLPPIAEWLAVDDFPRLGLSASCVSPYHHADWSRHIFWSKAGDGFFVVMDVVHFNADGPYTVTCTWRTPGYAALNERAWESRQGDDTFALICGEEVQAISEAEGQQGAASPYVLRQFREGEFRAGDAITFQNLFHVRYGSTGEMLDLQRIGPSQALVKAENSSPLAWCGADPRCQGMRTTGLAMQAVSAWVSPTEVALAGATQLAVEAAPRWRFECDSPVGLCLDLATCQAILRVDGPIGAPVACAVTLDGTPTVVSAVPGRVTTLSLPAEQCRQLAAALRDGLVRLANREVDIRAGQSLSRTPVGDWKPIWIFDGWTCVPERLRDVTVQAKPAPLDGFADQLVDTVLPEFRNTWQQWPAHSDVDVMLTLRKGVSVERLRLIGDSHSLPTLRAFRPLPQGITASMSNDGFQQDIRPCPVASEHGQVSLALRYYGQEDRLETVDVAVGQVAKQVHIHIPVPADGGPLVLHEIEVWGSQRVRPPVRHLLMADLDGMGQQALVANAGDELIALGENGTERWRQELPGPVSHLSCHDLDGDGRHCICLGLLGGELRILWPDGSLRQSIPLAELAQRSGDIFYGLMYSLNGLAVWQREPNGRAALVAGGYSLLVFLSPDGEMLGHSWADGSWQSDLAAVPSGEGEAPDLWVRNRWNHGICVYEGQAGFAPSGETVSFGGVRQPMFRALRKVIPFVTGLTVAFEWIRGSEGEGGRILAVAETGVGILSVPRREWLWRAESGTSIVAAVVADSDGDGQAEVLIGGADGFVASFARADGRPLRRLRTGAPVVGLCSWADQGLLVAATRQGVLALDKDWHVCGFYPLAIRRLSHWGDGKALLLRDDGVLQMLTLEGESKTESRF